MHEQWRQRSSLVAKRGTRTHIFAGSSLRMSSLPSSSRRAKIFSTALELRTQMVKLYVLVKWSKGANHIQHIKNIIGLIHEQSYQTVDAREHLAETRNILPNARERNHDVVTAIDILANGEPDRLPASIEAESTVEPPLSDSEARDIIDELNQAIRARLVCHEVLPLRLHSRTYTVTDGRVYLYAPGLFRIALTLSGNQDEDRWYLLSIVFDYTITGCGKEKFPTDLWDCQRNSFIDTANEVLAPRSAPGEQQEEKEEGEPGVATERCIYDRKGKDENAGHGSLKVPLQDDRPIVRLFNFLQSQALEYQLDILAFQAAELSRLQWRGNLAWSWRGRTLLVNYWTSKLFSAADTGDSATSRKPFDPFKGGLVELQVHSSGLRSARERLLATLSHPAPLDENHEAANSEIMNREQDFFLAMRWEVDEHMRSVESADDCQLSSGHQPIDAHDLDLEKLLHGITIHHASLSLRVLRRAILQSPFGRKVLIDPNSLIIRQGGEDVELTLPILDNMLLSVRVDIRSGKLLLRQELHQASSSSGCGSLVPMLSPSPLTSQLKDASEILNETPGAFVDVLRRVRTTAVLSNLESKAVYLGLQTQRRLNLNQEEYAKLGVQPCNLLYLPLQQCPSFYCVFIASEEATSAALISAVPFTYSAVEHRSTGNALVIQSLRWLDLFRIVPADGPSRKVPGVRAQCSVAEATNFPRSLMSTEAVARVHSFAVALTLSSNIQSQLRMRDIAFVFVPPSPKKVSKRRNLGRSVDSTQSIRHAEDVIPSVSARSVDIFGPSAASLLHNNVHLEVKKYWNPGQCCVCLSAKFKFNLPQASDRAQGQPSQSLITLAGGLLGDETVRCDASRGTLLFSTSNLNQALEIFAFEWQPIARIAALAQLLSLDSSKDSSTQSRRVLLHFDLQYVQFAYGPDHKFRASVGWQSAPVMNHSMPDLTPEPGYRLRFDMHRDSDISAAESSDENLSSNPHQRIQAALQVLLNTHNVLSLPMSDSASAKWSAFLSLLDSTLPLLNVLVPLSQRALQDASAPDVEFLSATWYRVTIAERYKLDVRITKGCKVVLQDAARSEFVDDDTAVCDARLDLAGQSPIPDLTRKFKEAIRETARLQWVGGKTPLSPPALVLGNTIACDLQAGPLLVESLLRKLFTSLSRSLAEVEGLE